MVRWRRSSFRSNRETVSVETLAIGGQSTLAMSRPRRLRGGCI